MRSRSFMASKPMNSISLLMSGTLKAAGVQMARLHTLGAFAIVLPTFQPQGGQRFSNRVCRGIHPELAEGFVPFTPSAVEGGGWKGRFRSRRADPGL